MENENKIVSASKDELTATVSDMQGEKIKKDKTILLGWILVIILLVSSVSSLFLGWVNYQKYQNTCAEIMKKIYTEMNRYIDEDYNDFLNECKIYLSPSTVGDILAQGSLFGRDNSEKADEIRKMQATAKEEFTKIGYPEKWDLTFVFQYTAFSQYAKEIFNGFNKNTIPQSTVLLNYGLICLLFIVLISVFIAQMNYNAHKNQEIILEEEKVCCKLNKKKSVDIPYSRIITVKRGSLHSVKIISPGASVKITMLKNQVEIVNQITDKVNQVLK